MDLNLVNTFNKGADYYNMDYSLSSFLGVLFITLFLGFTILFVFSAFNLNQDSSVKKTT